jgi:putative intracellular protease/amidase
MKFSSLAAAAALAVAGLAAPAFAQDAGLTVGAKIYGPNGGEIGTIEKIEGEAVVVNTGVVTAALPANSFGTSDKGPTLGWDKAELESAVTAANEQAAAELEAAIVAGAEVYSSDAVLLGKVTEVPADGNVVVELATGPAALPKAQMALNGDKLTFRASAAEVQAAASAASGANGGD